MANYNWFDNLTRHFSARYFGLPQGDLVGYAEWEAFVAAFPRFNAPPDAWPYLHAIRRVRFTAPPRKCPRLFVSHRQGDEHLALRIAWCANKENVEYWVDVLNLPKSLTQGPQALPPFKQIVLLAAIIEMALINCTHVTAVMTTRTVPSRWVPYEYGRIKDDPPARMTASCWRHPDVAVTDLPDYVHLAPVFTSELDLRSWLASERVFFPLCPGTGAGEWPYDDEPEELPKHSDTQPTMIVSTDA